MITTRNEGLSVCVQVYGYLLPPGKQSMLALSRMPPQRCSRRGLSLVALNGVAQ